LFEIWLLKIKRDEVEKEARRMESGGDQADGWEIQKVICQQWIKEGRGRVA
jgi:hypothetical protein